MVGSWQPPLMSWQLCVGVGWGFCCTENLLWVMAAPQPTAWVPQLPAGRPYPMLAWVDVLDF